MNQIKEFLMKYKSYWLYVLIGLLILAVLMYLASAWTSRNNAEIYGLKKELKTKTELVSKLQKELKEKEANLEELSQQVDKIQKSYDKLKEKINEKPKPNFNVTPDMSNIKREILASADHLNKSER